MKITVTALGSRGDNQPFLLLAQTLAQRGHDLTFACPDSYASLVDSLAGNVRFLPFPGDYRALSESPEARQAMGRSPFRRPPELQARADEILEGTLETCLEASRDADAVLYHPKTLVDAIGSLLPGKLIRVGVVPIFTPTRAFASPAFAGLPIPAPLRRASYRLTEAILRTVRTPIDRVRERHGIRGPLRFLDVPTLYGIGEAVLPRPDDYPPNHRFTGFWWRPLEEVPPLSSQLKTFLDTDRPRLALGFGSMPYRNETPLEAFLETLTQACGARVVVIRGSGSQALSLPVDPDLQVVDSVPYDALFPSVDATIQHGGAGTASLSLRHGRPAQICPVLHPFGDQSFWGRRVEALGVGPRPRPLYKLRRKDLVSGVRTLLDRETVSRARRLQQRLAEEDGLNTAADLVEQHVTESR